MYKNSLVNASNVKKKTKKTLLLTLSACLINVLHTLVNTCYI